MWMLQFLLSVYTYINETWQKANQWEKACRYICMQSVVTTDSHLQHMETRICNLKNLCNYEKRIYLLFVISRFSVSTRANKWNKCKKFRQWLSELYKSSVYHLVITTTNASSRLLILLLYYIIFISSVSRLFAW